MKLYVATYVDYGENCDGKARTLGVYTDKNKALSEVKYDMDGYIDNFRVDDLTIDYDNFGVWNVYRADIRCEWNIEEVDVDINNNN